MLRKLFKYDFIESCRWLWMVYAGLVLTAALSGFAARINLAGSGNHGAGLLLIILSTMLLVLLVGTIFVLTFVQIVVRFYRNLMKGEGYLMHTLPVHTWQLIASKLMSAVILIIFAFLVCLISAEVWILCSGTTAVLSEMGSSIGGMFNYYFSGMNGAGVIVRSVLSGLLGAVTTVLVCYASLALGQLSNNHRILMAFACFIGLRIVMSVLSSTVTLVQSAIHRSSQMLFTMMTGSGSLSRMIVQLLMCIACFAVTEELMRRHLNLE